MSDSTRFRVVPLLGHVDSSRIIALRISTELLQFPAKHPKRPSTHPESRRWHMQAESSAEQGKIVSTQSAKQSGPGKYVSKSFPKVSTTRALYLSNTSVRSTTSS